MDKAQDNPGREIRREFFAFRNGIVADKLRKAGDPHPVMMGCLLVDVQAITQGVSICHRFHSVSMFPSRRRNES